MEGAWSPNPSILSNIVEILRQADSPDTTIQRRLAEAVHQLDALPDAPCYFATLLTSGRGESPEVRQRAGLLLKNRVADLARQASLHSDSSNAGQSFRGLHLSVTPREAVPILSFVKTHVISALRDSDDIIRQTAGIILAALVHNQSVDQYPEVLPCLSDLLDHEDPGIADGAFRALAKVIEDELDRSDFMFTTAAFITPTPTGGGSNDAEGTPDSSSAEGKEGPFCTYCRAHLLPKLLGIAAAASGSSISRRRQALECLNLFQKARLFGTGDVFGEFFDRYWSTLGLLAMEPDLRLVVLQGMSYGVMLTPEAIGDGVSSLIPFVVGCLATTEPYEVRREALDILNYVFRYGRSVPIIRELLPNLIAVLVENSVYSEWDLLQMDQAQLQDDNASEKDSAQDVMPQVHRGGTKGPLNDDAEEDDDFDIEDMGAGNSDSQFKSTWGEGWTVRKGSALLIDHLSVMFGQEILQYIFPLIETRLQSSQWELRESAVLVLGAIAQGCASDLEPCLPGVLKLLLDLCSDKKPIIRSISVWTISRFASWYASQPEALRIVVSTMLEHVLDTNKRVQEAACSAFSTLEEEARKALLPHVPQIIDTFAVALETFQMRSLVTLLDTIGTLLESIGPELESEKLHKKILEPLVLGWLRAPPTEPTLVVTFECLTCAIMAIPQGMRRYAAKLTEHCLDVLRDALARVEAGNAAAEKEFPEGGESTRLKYTVGGFGAQHGPELALIDCSLYMLSAFCESLSGDETVLLVQKSDFLPMLVRCCRLRVPGSAVKQAAFILVGDLAQRAPQQLAPHVPDLMEQLLPHLATGTMAVVQNACWATGQIALYASANGELNATARSAAEELTKLIGVSAPGSMTSFQQHSSIRNACLTLGRLALNYASSVADIFEAALSEWCPVMERSAFDIEKIHAFRGLCNVLSVRETAAVTRIPLILDAIASLYLVPSPPSISPSPELSAESTGGIHGGLACHPGVSPPQAFTPSKQRVPEDLHKVLSLVVNGLRLNCPDKFNAAMTAIKPDTAKILSVCFT